MTADSVSTSRSDESFRGTAIVAYVLYLLGWPSLHLATIVALILAYVQRGEARGTIWESHFSNVIETFWISLIVGLIAIPLCFIGIGFVVLAFLVVWFLFRTIKGLIRAIDGRAYT
jgi:uncharacterized membrane protein